MLADQLLQDPTVGLRFESGWTDWSGQLVICSPLLVSFEYKINCLPSYHARERISLVFARFGHTKLLTVHFSIVIYLFILNFRFELIIFEIDMQGHKFSVLGTNTWKLSDGHFYRNYLHNDVLPWSMSMPRASAHQLLAMTCWLHQTLNGKSVLQV